MASMYDKVQRQPPKKGRDHRLLLVFLLALALLIGFALWVWSWNYTKQLHMEFVSSLSSSTVASYNEGGAKANVEGETLPIGGDELYAVYGKLTYTNQFRERSTPPSGKGIVIYYTDGATLKVWDAEMDVKSWTRDRGIFVQYTSSTGDSYSFITDRIQYIDIYQAIK